MAQADLPIAYDVMPEAVKAWRNIEMTVLRRRLAIVGLSVIVAVVAAWAFEALISIGKPSPFAHTRQGHLIGWIGFGTILLVFVYPMKKRMNRNRRWPGNWFRIHLVAGVMGPLLILLHSGAHLHAFVPSLALMAMAVVVVSGVVGQAIHYLALRTLNDRRRELRDQGLTADDVEVHVHQMAAQEHAFRLWQSIHAPMTLLFLVLAGLHVIGAVYFGGL